MWPRAVLCLLAYVLLALFVRADPVPEPAAVEGRGSQNRGQPELRDPNGATATLSHLLRSCRTCHGPGKVSHRTGKPNVVLFDDSGRLLPGLDRPTLLRGLRRTVARTPEEKRDWQVALAWLAR